MKQKLIVLAMIVLATVLIASPVLAAGSSRIMEVAKRTPTVISMTATIDSVDLDSRANTGKIDITIRMTNRAFIQYRGRSVEVVIADNTVCLDWVNKSKSVGIDCSALGDDDKISVNARIDPDTKVITARRVLRYQPRIR